MSSTYSLVKWRPWRWASAGFSADPKTRQPLVAAHGPDEACDRALAAAENEGWPLTTRRQEIRTDAKP